MMEVSRGTKPRRRVCEHCNKELCISQYTKHKQSFKEHGACDSKPKKVETKPKKVMARKHGSTKVLSGNTSTSSLPPSDNGGPSDEQILTAFTDPSKVQDGDPAALGLNQLVQQFTQLTSTVNQQLAAVNSKLLVMEERMAAYEAKANDDDEETSIYREPKVSIGFRDTLRRDLVGQLPDPWEFMFRMDNVYRAMKPENRPFVSTMGKTGSSNLTMVECEFGTVPKGSVLSYQRPLFPPGKVNLISNAPPMPALPLDGYRLDPPGCSFVPTAREQFHLNSIAISLYAAQKIEEGTREKGSRVDQHQYEKLRFSSARFGKVCAQKSLMEGYPEQAARSALKGSQTPNRKMESGTEVEYCRLMHVNYTSCGIVIHPDAPWLCATPDGIVYDPYEEPQFGITLMKCMSTNSHTECSYLEVDVGHIQIKKNHQYHWEVQGQLLVTGMQWCDFVVLAMDDFIVVRVRADAKVHREIRERMDHFYFDKYMPKLVALTST
ncbi:uncharacterized protein LOC134435498 [Engraulis encrasicolus]|uniref:uncharacterized protein LOC134435498 n=1 Tax=Engraulis encrasicolus TaxID=184585 RepID=UPI002FD51E35